MYNVIQSCYNKYMNETTAHNTIHIDDIQLLIERLSERDLVELIEHPDLPDQVRLVLEEEIEDRWDDE
jgi:hypothetical protein